MSEIIGKLRFVVLRFKNDDKISARAFLALNYLNTMIFDFDAYLHQRQ